MASGAGGFVPQTEILNRAETSCWTARPRPADACAEICGASPQGVVFPTGCLEKKPKNNFRDFIPVVLSSRTRSQSGELVPGSQALRQPFWALHLLGRSLASQVDCERFPLYKVLCLPSSVLPHVLFCCSCRDLGFFCQLEIALSCRKHRWLIS